MEDCDVSSTLIGPSPPSHLFRNSGPICRVGAQKATAGSRPGRQPKSRVMLGLGHRQQHLADRELALLGQRGAGDNLLAALHDARLLRAGQGFERRRNIRAARSSLAADGVGIVAATVAPAAEADTDAAACEAVAAEANRRTGRAGGGGMIADADTGR